MSYKISDICEINGFNLSIKDKWDYINYLDTANLNEGRVADIQYLKVGIDKIPSRAKRRVRKNDILISTVRPSQKHFGIIKNLVENLVASNGFAVLTADIQRVVPEYLYNYLIQDHVTTYLNGVAETSTSTYPSIKPSVIGELKIDLPLIEEQKGVSHILSTIDNKIEVNNKINETLENMTQEIFKRWFVDFEFPNEDGDPYKSSGGEMIESELGLIPKRWIVSSLKDVVNVIDNRGKTPQQANERTPFPIIDVKALGGETRIIDYNNCMKHVNQDTYNNWFRRGHPNEGDILLSTVGSLAELKLFMGNIGCIAQNVVALRCKCISNLYLYDLLKNIKSDLVAYNIGSVQPSIKVTHIMKHKILVPHESIINGYHILSQNITNKIYITHKETMRLNRIRNLLLPKLMSGEIRVPMEES